LAIHSRNEEVIREFGMRKPVSRMLVNTPSTQGAVGLSTSLFPSFTLGCGAVGGSATSDNVTPLNLMNVRRIAYDLGTSPCCGTAEKAHAPNIDVQAITSMIVEQLKQLA
jgi:hypothetical protein